MIEKQGTVLSKKDIEHLIEYGEPPLVEDLIDPKIQIQPNGVDLTVKTVEIFSTAGTIDFSNDDRVIAGSRTVPFDGLLLQPGVYKITLNEKVNIPLDLMAICQARSTLLRCGVTVGTAFWDAGFSGYGEAVLTVSNKYGVTLKENARVIQLTFFRLTSENADIDGYKGIYGDEMIK